MNSTLTVTDYLVIIVIVMFFTRGRSCAAGSTTFFLCSVDKKLDMLLRHFSLIHDDEPFIVGMSGQVKTLAKAGNKFEAIKLFREETGAGLKEAKEAVDAFLNGIGKPPA